MRICSCFAIYNLIFFLFRPNGQIKQQFEDVALRSGNIQLPFLRFDIVNALSQIDRLMDNKNNH